MPSPASEPRAKGRVSTYSLTVLCHLPWNVGSGRAGPCQFLPVLQQGSGKLRTRPLLSKPVPREHAAGWVREGGRRGVEPIAGQLQPPPSLPSVLVLPAVRSTPHLWLLLCSCEHPHYSDSGDLFELAGTSVSRLPPPPGPLLPRPALWCWRLELCPDALPLPRFHPHAAWPPRFVSWL